jgi:hypothetical protein
MSPGVVESQADKKRLEQSLLISILIWLLLMGALAFMPIRPDQIPETSMNPVYIDLAPEALETEPSVTKAQSPGATAQRAPQSAPAPTQPATSTSGTSASGTAANSAAPLPTASSPAGASSTARGSTASGRTAPSRSPAIPNPYQGRGGEDPFAPLSEADLAADNPEAPALPAGSAQAPDGEAARVSSPERSPGQGSSSVPSDALAQRVRSTTESLSERGSSPASQGQAQGAASSSDAGKNSSASGSSTASGTALSGTAAGTLLGSMDFGEGSGRKLISAPSAVIPAKLLEGQPTILETMVRFRIDKGGTVIALSIQFDPPLPLDIAEYLKTYVFSRWVFSSSNSDGQVRFKYSIKVQ